MSLIDFLKEERKAKKERRRLQKESKKKVRTPEEKRYRIYGFITVILIVFGVFFSTCRIGDNGYTWNKVIGITDEMIIELEKPVDDEQLFPDGKITDSDWNECDNVLKSAGINLDSDDDLFVNFQEFSITDRQTGALVKKLLTSINTSIISNICDLEIYAVGENFFMRSVVYLNLGNLIMGADLPGVYLTSISKVEVLNNSLMSLTNEVKINNLDNETNNEIVDVLNNNSSTKITNVANDIINTTITAFGEMVGMNIQLRHGCIDFKY